jgi:hypothetical protein
VSAWPPADETASLIEKERIAFFDFKPYHLISIQLSKLPAREPIFAGCYTYKSISRILYT